MNKKYFFLLIGISVFIGIIFLFRQSSLMQSFTPREIKSVVDSLGLFGPLAYIAFYTLASLLFIPASPLTLVGGALFGPLYGTIYTVVGGTLGALLAFFLSRMFGRRFITFGAGKVGTKLQFYDNQIKTHGFVTVLFLRFVPLFPFNGLNFALGLTKVSVRDYFFGTFFGIIPGTFVFVYFGNSLATLSPIKIGVALLLIVCLSVLGKYAKGLYDTK